MNCSKLTVPEIIAETEELARIIFSPSMVEDGQVSPSAFFMENLRNGPETYISVWRSCYITPSPENITIKPRQKGDSLVGYAVISVSDCCNICYEDYEMYVKPYPSNRNPAHAGIHVNKGTEMIKGNCLDPSYLILAMMIAQKCSFVKFEGSRMCS